MKFIFLSIGITMQLWGHSSALLSESNVDEYTTATKLDQTIDLRSVDAELIEAGVFYLTNLYRGKNKRTQLNYNTVLSDAAYLHSQQMQMHDFFDHTNRKNKALSSLDKRAEYTGYTNYSTLAENIFYGYIDIQNPGTYIELCEFIVNGFVNSKGHRKNLLASDISENGNGIYFKKYASEGYWYFYFTQDFGKK